MRLSKLPTKKEPKVKSSYLVLSPWSGSFHEAKNLKEVRQVTKGIADVGDTIQVFKVDTNFIQAYKRTK